MSSKFIWLLLVLLLSIRTFGLWMCCFIVFLVFVFLLGAFSVLHATVIHRSTVKIVGSSSKSEKLDYAPFYGLPKVILQMDNFPKTNRADTRLTGSNEIDTQLREILQYIERDFIQSWYTEVSANEEFVNSFNTLCKSLINNISNKLKEVNWVSFFTHRVVEDFTTHLRLYRHTEASHRKHKREYPDVPKSIESIFFEKELDFEKRLCRENVCSAVENETEYFKSVCDVLLYLLLPPDDFENKILKHFLREVLISSVFEPLLSSFSDPDVINQNVIWMCKDHVITNKTLVNILRRSDNEDELTSFIQISKHEIKVHNSKDSGDKDETKKYMKSIAFVQNVAKQRIERMRGHSKYSETDSAEFYLDFDSVDGSTFEKKEKLVSLPFDVVLNNNIALHYFTQYLLNVDSDGYVFFYHNIEGFRTTVEMQLSDEENNKESNMEKLRIIAQQLFESYLGPSAASKIQLDDQLLKKLQSRLKTEDITESCFDEVQEKVYAILENEFYLNGFKDSQMYIKLLAELDLLNDMSLNSDVDSLCSARSEDEEKYNLDVVVPTDEDMLNELLKSEISTEDMEFPAISSGPLIDETKEIGILFAEVHSTGITHHGGRTFAVYAISVSHFRLDGTDEKWLVARRYSEFYEFHETVTAKFPVISSFNFPSRWPFNNLTRPLLEKRRQMLNEFIQFLLSSEILTVCEGLKLMVYNFLQPNPPEKEKKSIFNLRTVGNFINPIKSSVKSVGQFAKLVPDTIFELKGGFMKTFFKNNDSQSIIEEKPIAPKDTRADDIPFRIMLLLMDEIFNLRNKDLWFRRRIMALLRQIMKTMKGGKINRQIRDYVQGMTSVSQIAEWLKLLSKTIWPDGHLAAPTAERDYNTKMRTRIVTKVLLFCAIPDELKAIIGYETSFKGAMLIFNVFQHPSLNKRLLLVLFESFLKTLFPNHNIPELILKLHPLTSKSASSRSPSVDKISTASSQEFKMESQSPQMPTKSQSPQMPTKSFESPSVSKISPKLEARSKQTKSKEPKQHKLGFSNFLQPSPKPKRKKSTETAIFYVDLPKDEDSVILPLKR